MKDRPKQLLKVLWSNMFLAKFVSDMTLEYVGLMPETRAYAKFKTYICNVHAAAAPKYTVA